MLSCCINCSFSLQATHQQISSSQSGSSCYGLLLLGKGSGLGSTAQWCNTHPVYQLLTVPANKEATASTAMTWDLLQRGSAQGSISKFGDPILLYQPLFLHAWHPWHAQQYGSAALSCSMIITLSAVIGRFTGQDSKPQCTKSMRRWRCSTARVPIHNTSTSHSPLDMKQIPQQWLPQ